MPAPRRLAGRAARVGISPQNHIPKTFGKIEAEWRTWQDDICDFCDANTSGMRSLLKAVEKSDGKLDDEWVAKMLADGHPVKAVGDRLNLYRALKTLTEGEARKVVMSVSDEDRFRAWKALHQRYGSSLAATHGKAICDITQMVVRLAKTQPETR